MLNVQTVLAENDASVTLPVPTYFPGRDMVLFGNQEQMTNQHLGKTTRSCLRV